MHHTLAIITVVYKNYTVLEDFFASLEKQTDRNFHLFIADLSEEKKPITSSLPMTIIPSANKGYAHGVNVGIETALKKGITQFCVINDDIFFEKDFVSNVHKSLETHNGSVIGGKIYYAPGYEYHKERYEKKDLGNVIWYAGGHIDWAHVLAHHRGVDEVDNGQYDAVEETDFITGCLTCFDKSVIEKIGLWNEDYFLYFEDADFTERAQRQGLKLIYDPSIVIWHKNSQSTDGSGSTLHQTYQNKNRVMFALKYAPFRTKVHVVKNYLFDNLFRR